MDWGRAKTILIIVFFITDLFLGYQYINQNQQTLSIISQDKIDETVSQLSKQNIFIHGNIPHRAIDMPSIKVKYKNFNKDEMIKIFFAGKESRQNVTIDKDSVTMENEDILVRIKNEKEFYYVNKKIELKGNSINEEKCTKLVEDFLGNMGIYAASVDVEKKLSNKGYMLFSGIQKYKGMFVDGTYVEIMATDKGIYQAKVLWFEDIKSNEENKKSVISPLKALQKYGKYFSDNRNAVNIYEIKQGYYFGANKADQFNLSMIEAGTAVPVWRIKGDKATIFINAYNGQLEN